MIELICTNIPAALLLVLKAARLNCPSNMGAQSRLIVEVHSTIHGSHDSSCIQKVMNIRRAEDSPKLFAGYHAFYSRRAKISPLNSWSHQLARENEGF